MRLIGPRELYKARRAAEHAYAVHRHNPTGKRAAVLIKQEYARELGLLDRLHDVGKVPAEREYRRHVHNELGFNEALFDDSQVKHDKYVKPDMVLVRIPLMDFIQALREYDPTKPPRHPWLSS